LTEREISAHIRGIEENLSKKQKRFDKDEAGRAIDEEVYNPSELIQTRVSTDDASLLEGYGIVVKRQETLKERGGGCGASRISREFRRLILDSGERRRRINL